jgi:hypothetical protein
MKLLDRLFNHKSENNTKDLGRNDFCWCGSGKKYKRCHLEQDEHKARSQYGAKRRA